MEIHTPGVARSEVFRHLGRLPDIDRDQGEALLDVARHIRQPFWRCEAVASIGGHLHGSVRDEAFGTAWSETSALHPFRGRSEAQALLSAAAARSGQPAFVAGAIQSAVAAIQNTDERLKFDDWEPDNPGLRMVPSDEYGKPRVSLPILKMYGFAEPFETLAPVLTDSQLHWTLQRLTSMHSNSARFGSSNSFPGWAAPPHERVLDDPVTNPGAFTALALARAAPGRP